MSFAKILVLALVCMTVVTVTAHRHMSAHGSSAGKCPYGYSVSAYSYFEILLSFDIRNLVFFCRKQTVRGAKVPVLMAIQNPALTTGNVLMLSK